MQEYLSIFIFFFTTIQAYSLAIDPQRQLRSAEERFLEIEASSSLSAQILKKKSQPFLTGLCNKKYHSNSLRYVAISGEFCDN
jgi:hypothetical protein